MLSGYTASVRPVLPFHFPTGSRSLPAPLPLGGDGERESWGCTRCDKCEQCGQLPWTGRLKPGTLEPLSPASDLWEAQKDASDDNTAMKSNQCPVCMGHRAQHCTHGLMNQDWNTAADVLTGQKESESVQYTRHMRVWETDTSDKFST